MSFDADGTLLDFERAMRDALAGSLTEIRQAAPGPATEALTVKRLIAIRDEVAREAGMRAVWLNREDAGKRVDAPEEVGEIRTLEDLPALLERIK